LGSSAYAISASRYQFKSSLIRRVRHAGPCALLPKLAEVLGGRWVRWGALPACTSCVICKTHG